MPQWHTASTIFVPEAVRESPRNCIVRIPLTNRRHDMITAGVSRPEISTKRRPVMNIINNFAGYIHEANAAAATAGAAAVAAHAVYAVAHAFYSAYASYRCQRVAAE
jgi:hypothetical protein